MKGFLIKEGTPVLAAKRNSYGELEVEPRVTKKEVLYLLEDLVIDPLNPSDVPSERHFANRGFFGFQLKPNKLGYELIICHGKNIHT